MLHTVFFAFCMASLLCCLSCLLQMQGYKGHKFPIILGESGSRFSGGLLALPLTVACSDEAVNNVVPLMQTTDQRAVLLQC